MKRYLLISTARFILRDYRVEVPDAGSTETLYQFKDLLNTGTDTGFVVDKGSTRGAVIEFVSMAEFFEVLQSQSTISSKDRAAIETFRGYAFFTPSAKLDTALPEHPLIIENAKVDKKKKKK